ncbi:MAG: TfoX/Sxy family protein [Beijerinckiaceae bacterium]
MDAAAIRDVFSPFGPVRARRMFGGYGIFSGDVMIALEIDGEIFLKADAQSEPYFLAAGSQAYVYPKAKRPFVMSYWQLPPEALDDPDVLRQWALRARDAALRGASQKNH